MAIKKVKKYQEGGDVPKGMRKGEMTGKLYSKEEAAAWEKKQADAMNKQAGYPKKAPAPIPSKKMGGIVKKKK